MQNKQMDKLILETVINLTEKHSLCDIKKLFTELHNEYDGFEVFEISIHKDEGYFKDSTGLEYRPEKDIFFDNKTKLWFLEKSKDEESNFIYRNKVDISIFEKVKNIHAHVIYSKFDMNLGKNAGVVKNIKGKKVKNFNKKDMSDLQSFVASKLGMKRGRKFAWTEEEIEDKILNPSDYYSVENQKAERLTSQ